MEGETGLKLCWYLKHRTKEDNIHTLGQNAGSVLIYFYLITKPNILERVSERTMKKGFWKVRVE